MTSVTQNKFFQKIDGLDRGLITIFVLGLIVAGVALLRGILIDRQVQVEYITSADSEVSQKIVIDVGGAVMSSGVYDLPLGSRVKDALVAAGGLSEKADREYCEKNINLAEIVKDGEKIYIPYLGVSNTGSGYLGEGSEASTIGGVSTKVNVNTASVQELNTLVGVGPVRSESIVKKRPYKNLDELVTKGALTKSILEKNREVLAVY